MSRHVKILIQGCLFIALIGFPLSFKVMKWYEGIKTEHFMENYEEMLNSK